MALNNPTRSSLFLLQQETLPTPPAGFVELNTPLIVVPTFATIETNRLRGDMNSKASTVDSCRTSTSFLASVNMRKTGSTLTDPAEYNELLKVSGFEEVIGVDNVTLTNKLDSIARGSALAYMDGQKFSMTDTLVGSSEMVFNVGEIATLNTTLSGYIDDAVPVAEANPTVALNQEGVLIVSCADVITMDGTAIPAQGITITTNPDIANLYTMNNGGGGGYKYDEITDYGLECQITFPVDSATFGREASLIKAGSISAIRIVLGADSSGNPVDGESVVIIADTSKAVTYADEVNQNLLQRVLTLRLYDNLPTNSAIKMVTGTVSAL